MGKVRTLFYSKCCGKEAYDAVALGQAMDEKGEIFIMDIHVVVCSECHKMCEINKNGQEKDTNFI